MWSQKIVTKKLIQIIHTLPVVEAQVILLCDVHQLTYEEGASVLDLKLNTYKSHIFRGRKRLKELLKEERVKMTNDKPHSEQDDYKELLQEALQQRPASLPDGKQEQVLKNR